MNETRNTAEASNDDVVFVSRQPIYTTSVELFAYALVYEKPATESCLKTFFDVGLETLVGDTLTFMNVTRTLLLDDYCKALPKERLVLEVSRTVAPDEAVIRALSELSQAGYKLALDDFQLNEQYLQLLECADYVNLNFHANSQDRIFEHIVKLGRSKSKAKPIATNLETHEQFDKAARLGFEIFRGSCFNKPKLTLPPRVPINRLSTLQLALKLQEPELSTAELEKMVSQDLAISYKLLHYVNSAALSLSRNIESIKHAIQMVGTERIRTWASLLLLSKLDDKPAELIITAFVRGKMAERLAVASGAPNPESYYMVGLFSVVDALLNVPMPEAIQLLPFSKTIREALVSHEGPLGRVLDCVLAYESGHWAGARLERLDRAAIRQSYLDAVSASRTLPKFTKQDRLERKLG